MSNAVKEGDPDPDEPCALLPWDSEFFGFPVARVRGHALTEPEADWIDHWCEARGIACVYFVAGSNDPATVIVAQRHGFGLVDLRTTLDRALSGDISDKPNPVARPVASQDVPVLRAIGGTAYTDSRFYFDPHFSRDQCDELFDRWTHKACQRSLAGEGAAWVVEREGRPAGYITCIADPAAGVGGIELIGVDAAFRGRGVGRELVVAAIAQFSRWGLSRATVVTQGRNIAAQRLYQRCGFLTASVDLYYHKWYRPPASAGG